MKSKLNQKLKAPFPWFGGKSIPAPLVWERFGDVSSFNDPCCGSLAMLWARPAWHRHRIETVNDKDCYLANFWRALQHDPDGVAYHADWPVNEVDLHARHRWLVEVARTELDKIRTDPDYYDVKVAGWWVWGQCLWIGSGWCQRPDWEGRTNAGRYARGVNAERVVGYGKAGYGVEQKRRPHLSGEQGIINKGRNPSEWKLRPHLSGEQGIIKNGTNGTDGTNGQRTVRERRENPHMQHKRPKLRGRGDDGVAYRRWQGGGAGGGSGVHAPSLMNGASAQRRPTWQKPDLSGDSGASGRGIHASARTEGIYEYMRALAQRLRRVRVCCGDWGRVLTPSVTTYIGVTGVFLDPPYDHSLRERCYSEDHNISVEVRKWAIANGNNPKMRIALCGYLDEHGPHMPSSWECVAWKAHGGYSRTERGRENRSKERIWFSPHCLKPGMELWERMKDEG